MNIYKWPLCSSSAAPLFLLLQFLFVTLFQWCVQHFKIVGLQIQEHSQWMLRFWMRALCYLIWSSLCWVPKIKEGILDILVVTSLFWVVLKYVWVCACLFVGVCLAMPANVTRSVGASDMHVCMCDDVSVWLGMYAWVWNCIYVCRREGTIHWDHTTVGTQHSGNIIVRLTWWVGKGMKFKTINNLFSNSLNPYSIVDTLFLFPVHLLTPCSTKQNAQHSQFIPRTNYSLAPRH